MLVLLFASVCAAVAAGVVDVHADVRAVAIAAPAIGGCCGRRGPVKELPRGSIH